MKFPKAIKAFFTLFLFGLFALAITPKQALHDVLTNHQHNPLAQDQAVSVGKDRFNCDDENFVAESPFISQLDETTIQVPVIFLDLRRIYLESYSFRNLFFSDLRGPPAFS